MPEVGVVIAGGGRGLRVGGRTPKQFRSLNGIPVLLHTIRRFDRHPEIAQIVVVVPPAYVRRAEHIVRRGGCRRVVGVVAGGDNRQDSVRRGLESFPRPPGIVLVHDAVRPCVSRAVITAVIRGARKYGAAVVGVRVTDTIKVGTPDGFYRETLDRTVLWAVQTPQAFRRNLLERSHAAAVEAAFTGTDEASLAERIGIRVRIVEGEYGNLKITTSDDFKLAKMNLKRGR
jgi:2-C-methyl-D-erythritol 4-phosphate cytidylyltransferase